MQVLKMISKRVEAIYVLVDGSDSSVFMDFYPTETV